MIPLLLTILVGLASGVILATPPGVINLTILHNLSRGKPRNAVWVGAGSATLDIFYGALAMYSASAAYSALNGFIQSNPISMKVLEALLVVSILGFAVYKLFIESKEAKPPILEQPALTSRKLHPYVLGCLLALTHILVPTFLPGYAYLAAILINSEIIPETNFHYWIMSISFGIGNFLWVLGLVSYFQGIDPAVETKRFRRLNLTIGFLFLAVGLVSAVKLAASAL